MVKMTVDLWVNTRNVQGHMISGHTFSNLPAVALDCSELFANFGLGGRPPFVQIGLARGWRGNFL